MKNILSTFLCCLTMSILLNSCEKNVVAPPVAPTFGNVKVSFNLQQSGVDYTIGDTILHPSLNRKYLISTLKFYANYMKLVSTTGVEVDVNEFYLYESYDVKSITASVPAGTYNKIKYDVGVKEKINHENPNIYPLGHPLAVSSSMNWGQTLGYLFLMLEGYTDPTGSASIFSNFKYDCGLDSLYKSVTLPITAVTIAENATTPIEIQIDVNQLFDGNAGNVDIVNNNITHSTGVLGFQTANTVLDNFVGATSF